ncbi:hypothetical protein HY419_00525, partial [candidate division WWE3 bacterium]|nr:hypothetical protein [candidate division WWE3 bacterium]
GVYIDAPTVTTNTSKYALVTQGTAGNVGIGTTAPGGQLEVDLTSTAASGNAYNNYYVTNISPDSGGSTGTFAGIQNTVTATAVAGGNMTGQIHGINTVVTYSRGAALDEVFGNRTIVQHNAGNTITDAYGAWNEIETGTSSTNITTAYATYSKIDKKNTGTFTNAYGNYISVTSTAGTLTTGYGLYIEDVAGSTDYGIYQAGTDDINYFAGNVGIGTTAPGSLLQVVGGNVGIGTTAATTHALFVQRSSATAETSGWVGAFVNPTYNVGVQFGAVNTNVGAISGIRADGAGGSRDIVLNPFAGNVGIGTTGPGAIFDVRQGVDGDVPIIFANTTDGAASTNETVTLRFQTDAGAGGSMLTGYVRGGKEGDYVTTDGDRDGYLSFATFLNAVEGERMRITSAGNVGIGTTTPTSTQGIAKIVDLTGASSIAYR